MSTSSGFSRARAGAFLGCALAIAISCSHDATPVVAPDEHPPLPEGTPIGYLIDDASELHLRDEQLSQLRAIDGDLALQLDALDAEQHGPSTVAKPNNGGGGGRHSGGGGRHGGGGGGGGGGGRRGGGGGGGDGSQSSPAAIANANTIPTTLPADGSGSAAGSAAPPPPPPVARTEDRAGDIKAALVRAFAVLDPDQQPVARKVLADHGIDVDHPNATPAAVGSGLQSTPPSPSAGSEP